MTKRNSLSELFARLQQGVVNGDRTTIFLIILGARRGLLSRKTHSLLGAHCRSPQSRSRLSPFLPLWPLYCLAWLPCFGAYRLTRRIDAALVYVFYLNFKIFKKCNFQPRKRQRPSKASSWTHPLNSHPGIIALWLGNKVQPNSLPYHSASHDGVYW